MSSFFKEYDELYVHAETQTPRDWVHKSVLFKSTQTNPNVNIALKNQIPTKNDGFCQTDPQKSNLNLIVHQKLIIGKYTFK